MTAAELVRMLLRRWHLTIVGAVCSFAVLWAALHQAPVYFTQLDVVLLPPTDVRSVNTLRDGPYALSPLAGLIVSDVNGGEPVAEMATASTTLYGEGVHRGERVRLRNRGTQWQPVYDAGVIDVQVVDSDPEAVRGEAAALVAQLEGALAERQDGADVAEPARVSLRSSPVDPVVQEVGASRSRAAGAIAILGGAMTTLVVALVDRRLVRRRVRRSEEVVVP